MLPGSSHIVNAVFISRYTCYVCNTLEDVAQATSGWHTSQKGMTAMELGLFPSFHAAETFWID
jgi:hypothetical protein